jgi:diaminopimelate epimerase
VNYHFVNSGVPHAVVEVEDLNGIDVRRLGAEIRRHADFAPAGTNANFIAITGPQSLRIRTYERGVEDETLACGTGIVAGGLIAGRLQKVRPPVAITCASGDVLTVDYRLTAESAENVTLRGPAVHVFQGTLEY